MKIKLLFALLLGSTALAQTISSNVPLLANGSTGNAVTITGTGTTFTPGTPGAPTFNLVGGCGFITAQTVTSATSANLTISPGTCNGHIAVNAPNLTSLQYPALAAMMVQPAFSAAQPFVVNGTTTTVAFTGIGASWTSSTAFALSGCPTASITAKTVPNATTANLTINAGSTDCTIIITDPSTSHTTTLAVHTPQHFYVDQTIGGTRYSSNVTAGLCDGTADTAPIGTTPNQHCAFSDLRYMWQDGTYTTNGYPFPAYGWLMQGGDTLTIEGSIAQGKTNMVGFTTSGSAGSCGPNGSGVYFGICADAQDSGMPSPPSGIATQHTVIQGMNAASCSADTARTQLLAGYNVSSVIYMGTGLKYTTTTPSFSDYVDLACLDMLEGPNYAPSGITFSPDVNNVTLTNIKAHGFAVNGFFGSTGGNITATNIKLVGNAQSGWDTDKVDGWTGFGSLNVTNYLIQGNGCYEEYPVVDALPYQGCTDQSHGGYGDGFGTATVQSPPPGWQVHFDQGEVSYNTQDGLDALHIAGTGSSMTITRTLAYGNMGQQFKAGGAQPIVRNNVIFFNAGAMCSGYNPGGIPGFPSGFNASLTDCYRASAIGVFMELPPTGATGYFQGNTVYSKGAVAVEVEPENQLHGAVWAGTESFQFNDNVSVNFLSATGSGDNSNELYNASNDPTTGTYAFAQYSPLSNAGGSWTNNASIGSSKGCPRTGSSNSVCADPGLMDEAYHAYGYGNMQPSSTSSAVYHAGVPISGLTADYLGVTRNASTPSIGAYEAVGGSTPTVANPAASPAGESFSTSVTVALSTVTGGASIYYSTTGTASCTSTPYAAPLTFTSSTTLSAIACESGYLNSSVVTNTYSLTTPATNGILGGLTILGAATIGPYTASVFPTPPPGAFVYSNLQAQSSSCPTSTNPAYNSSSFTADCWGANSVDATGLEGQGVRAPTQVLFGNTSIEAPGSPYGSMMFSVTNPTTETPTATGASGASSVVVSSTAGLGANFKATGTGIGSGAQISTSWDGTSTTIPLTVANSGTVNGTVSFSFTANALFANHLSITAANLNTIGNMIDDFWYYLPAGQAMEAFEVDPDIFNYNPSLPGCSGTSCSTHMEASMQCDVDPGSDAPNQWRFWNTATDQWVRADGTIRGTTGTSYSCATAKTTGVWHHYQLYATYNVAAETYAYQTLVIDGAAVFTNLNLGYSGAVTGYPTSTNFISVQNQIDLTAASSQTVPTPIYYDLYKLTAW